MDTDDYRPGDDPHEVYVSEHLNDALADLLATMNHEVNTRNQLLDRADQILALINRPDEHDEHDERDERDERRDDLAHAIIILDRLRDWASRHHPDPLNDPPGQWASTETDAATTLHALLHPLGLHP